MVETLIFSAGCLIVGGAIGGTIGFAVGRKREKLSIHKDNLSNRKSSTPPIPSAFAVQVFMVERACRETMAEHDEENLTYVEACRIVEKSIPQINRFISSRAKQNHTLAHVVIRTKNDAMREEGYKSADRSLPKSVDIIYTPQDAMGYVAGLLRDTYGKYGYDTDAVTDSDWLGHIFVSLYIDWSNGIDPEQLKHIEFSSQVEAFKAGVPLEDILA